MHGFAHFSQSGEVHHRIRLMLFKDSRDRLTIANVAYYELGSARYGWTLAANEVVIYDCRVSRREKLARNNTADVASTTSDQNSHRALRVPV